MAKKGKWKITFKGNVWDFDEEGAKQMSEQDYNNMALFQLTGTKRFLKSKVKEWEERDLRFRDLESKKVKKMM